MELYSTRNKNQRVSFKEAVINGLADDGGLYLPIEIPKLDRDFIKNLHRLSPIEIYFEIAQKLIGKEIPSNELLQILESVFTFKTPLISVHSNVYSLELFHGPTMSFKDIGARFMSRLLTYFYANESKTLNVIVATSGDTGSAIAAGFFDIPGINVFILYPKGKVSDIQEKQLTTWGKNITALEVNGTFDDCQKIVKQLLSDKELNKTLSLIAANSINIARLYPQSFYYFSSFAELQPSGKPIAYSVPSGNYGNLTGGILAQKMGLPINQFIASTNSNDIVPKYLKSGIYSPARSIQTISNAMDVGAPSNFERLLSLFPDFSTFQNAIKGYSFLDDETKKILREVHKEYHYTMDPHGAVAYLGLRKYLSTHPETNGVFLETAHPAKFKDVVEDILDIEIEIPEKLLIFTQKKKQSIFVEYNYQEVVDIIKKRN